MKIQYLVFLFLLASNLLTSQSSWIHCKEANQEFANFGYYNSYSIHDNLIVSYGEKTVEDNYLDVFLTVHNENGKVILDTIYEELKNHFLLNLWEYAGGYNLMSIKSISANDSLQWVSLYMDKNFNIEKIDSSLAFEGDSLDLYFRPCHINHNEGLRYYSNKINPYFGDLFSIIKVNDKGNLLQEKIYTSNESFEIANLISDPENSQIRVRAGEEFILDENLKEVIRTEDSIVAGDFQSFIKFDNGYLQHGVDETSLVVAYNSKFELTNFKAFDKGLNNKPVWFNSIVYNEVTNIYTSAFLNKDNDENAYYINLISFDQDLNEIWHTVLFANKRSDHELYNINVANDGGYLLSGEIRDLDSGFNKAYVIKTDAEGIVSSNNPNLDLNHFSLYPNPSDGLININTSLDYTSLSYQVYNVTGQLLSSNSLDASSIDLSYLLNGNYFLKIYSNGDLILNKMVTLAH